MEKDFDPYYKWLGIPPRDQPPNHYRLLSIETFEEDRDVIDAAANRVMSYLKDLAVGDEAQHSQTLLNQVSRARLCLLNRQKKVSYDAELRAELAAKAAEGGVAPSGGVPMAGELPSGPPVPTGPPSSPPPVLRPSADPPLLGPPPDPAILGPNIKIGHRPPRKIKGESARSDKTRHIHASGRRRRLSLVVLLAVLAIGAAVFAIVARPGSDRFQPAYVSPVDRASSLGQFRGGDPLTEDGQASTQEPEAGAIQDDHSRPGQPPAARAPVASTEPADSTASPAPPRITWPAIFPGPSEPGVNGKVPEGSSTSGPTADLPERDNFVDPGLVDPAGPIHPMPSKPLPSAPGSAGPEQVPGDPDSQVAGNPFRDLPVAVDLPSSGGEFGLQSTLGPVYATSSQPCAIRLLGGENAIRGADHFLLRETGGSPREQRWDFLINTGGTEKPIASLAIDGSSQLAFAWRDTAASEEAAGNLGNCALLLTSSGGSPHALPLRQPAQHEAIVVDLSRPPTKEDVKLDFAPDAKSVFVQVCGLEGAQTKLDPPVSAVADDGHLTFEVTDGGGLLVFDVKVQLKRTLQLTITPRLQADASDGPTVRSVVLRLDERLSRYQAYIGQIIYQQQQQLPRVSGQAHTVLRQKLESELTQANAMLVRLQELQQLVAARDKKLGLCLRVYFDAEGTPVDLLHIGSQADAETESPAASAAAS